MTQVDLTRSQFLLPLLQNMLQGLTQLSISDGKLNQKVYELHHFLSDPKNVDGEGLMQIIDNAKDLASSYDIKSDLPSIFYNAKEELEHILKSKKLIEMDNKQSQLNNHIERFYKLSFGGF